MQTALSHISETSHMQEQKGLIEKKDVLSLATSLKKLIEIVSDNKADVAVSKSKLVAGGRVSRMKDPEFRNDIVSMLLLDDKGRPSVNSPGGR